jgi:hypothetical protein
MVIKVLFEHPDVAESVAVRIHDALGPVNQSRYPLAELVRAARATRRATATLKINAATTATSSRVTSSRQKAIDELVAQELGTSESAWKIFLDLLECRGSVATIEETAIAANALCRSRV